MAKRARKAKSKRRSKVGTVMSEYKRGKLRSGSGGKVKKRKQAIAIALNEAREAGERVRPRKKARSKRSKSKKS